MTPKKGSSQERSLTANPQHFHINHKELQFVQQKTKKLLVTSLPDIVYESVAAYILRGRPNSSSKNVFVRSFAPYNSFKDGVSISSILRRRMKDAGIIHIIGDGKTFHGLRRFFATETERNFPISIVAQLLGHTGTKSTRQYIGYNIEKLRECSLDIT
jgi:integrase